MVSLVDRLPLLKECSEELRRRTIKRQTGFVFYGRRNTRSERHEMLYEKHLIRRSGTSPRKLRHLRRPLDRKDDPSLKRSQILKQFQFRRKIIKRIVGGTGMAKSALRAEDDYRSFLHAQRVFPRRRAGLVHLSALCRTFWMTHRNPVR